MWTNTSIYCRLDEKESFIPYFKFVSNYTLLDSKRKNLFNLVKYNLSCKRYRQVNFWLRLRPKNFTFELVDYWTHKHARAKAHKLVYPSTNSTGPALYSYGITSLYEYTYEESDRAPFFVPLRPNFYL